MFNSPHYAPNSNFNFWFDLQQNVTARNKWEECSGMGDPNDSSNNI